MGEPTAEALKSTMDKLKLTNEEVNRFEKAFKDPKFMDMFRIMRMITKVL